MGTPNRDFECPQLDELLTAGMDFANSFEILSKQLEDILSGKPWNMKFPDFPLEDCSSCSDSIDLDQAPEVMLAGICGRLAAKIDKTELELKAMKKDLTRLQQTVSSNEERLRQLEKKHVPQVLPPRIDFWSAIPEVQTYFGPVDFEAIRARDHDENLKSFERIVQVLVEWPRDWLDRFTIYVCKVVERVHGKKPRSLFEAFCISHRIVRYHLHNFNASYRKGLLIKAERKKLEPQGLVEGSEPLESVNVTESSANVTFVDERPQVVAEVHTTGDITTGDEQASIAEEPWSLEKMLTRETFIESFEWSVTHKAGQVMKKYGLPKVLLEYADWTVNARAAKLVGFMRAGIRLRFMLNGTRFHQGRLLAFFMPLAWDNDSWEEYYTYKNSICFPYVILDASVSNVGVLDVPFVHLQTHWSQDAGTMRDPSINALGRVYVMPLNVLRAAEESTQRLVVSVYSSLVQPETHLPTNVQHLAYGDGLVSTKTLQPQGLEAFLKRSAGKAIESGVGLADKFTGGLVTGVGNAVTNLLGIGDKPTDPVGASPIINRTCASLAHGAGLDRSTRLGLSPVSQSEVNVSQIGSTDADFNILTLAQIPTLLHTFEWRAAHAPGDRLWTTIVSPVYLPDPRYGWKASDDQAQYDVTMLAYVSRPFVYWRGSLVYRIQLVKTPFHSGRLMICYDPTSNSGRQDLTIINAQNKNIVVVDVEEQQELTIDIPYFSTRPWLRCDHLTGETVFAHSAVYNGMAVGESMMGTLTFYVQNALVRPGNVADTIDVNVFIAAGSDFELAVPNALYPLDVNKPTPSVYGLDPMYARCGSGSPYSICDNKDFVFEMHKTWKLLFRSGRLTDTGAQWYKAKAVLPNSDTDALQWEYDAAYLARYLEEPSSDCARLIVSMPTDFGGDEGDCGCTVPQSASNTTLAERCLVRAICNDGTWAAQDSELKWHVFPVDNYAFNKYDVKQKKEGTAAGVQSFDGWIAVIRRGANDIGLLREDGTERTVDFGLYCAVKELSCSGTKLRAQGLETYVTGRGDAGPVMTVTMGKRTDSSVAKSTLSENAMNLQTVLRRYYPIYVSGSVSNVNEFTLLTVPVTPTFAYEDLVPIIGYGYGRSQTTPLAWFARLFAYWRGSLRYKLVLNTDAADYYVWHDPTAALGFSNVSGMKRETIQGQMMFASDLAVTRVQQSIEVEVPFYSAYNQLLLDAHSSGSRPDLRAQAGTLFIAIRNSPKPMNFSLFISTGDDFMMNVLKAPPIVFETGQLRSREDNAIVEHPEFARVMHDQSINIQVPSLPVFWGDKTVWKTCPIPASDEKPEDFQVSVIEDVGFLEAQGLVDMKMSSDTDGAIRRCVETFEVLAAEGVFAKQIAESVSQIPAVLKTEAFIDKASLLTDSLTRSQSEVVAMGRDIGSSVGGVVKTTINICTGVSLVRAIMKLFTKGPSVNRMLKLLMCIATLTAINSSDLIDYAWSWMSGKLSDWLPGQVTEGLQSQGWLEEIQQSDLASYMSAHKTGFVTTLSVVAVAVYAMVFGRFPQIDKFKDWIVSWVERDHLEPQGASRGFAESMRDIHFSTLGFSALEKAYRNLSDFIARFVAWVIGEECPEIIAKREAGLFKDRVLAWLKECDSLQDEDVIRQALRDPLVHNKFYKIVQEGDDLLEICVQNSMATALLSLVREGRNQAHKLVTQLVGSSSGQGFRYAPFSVFLAGETSTGKSKLMEEVAHEMLKTIGAPRYHGVYYLPPRDDYMSGYEGESIVMWDDMGQNPDQDGMFADFIQMVSNADMRLNRAELEKKGQFFISKGIVATTNTPDLDTNKVRDINAFRQRRHVLVQMNRRAGVTIEALRNAEYDPDYGHVDFDIMDPMKPGVALFTKVSKKQVFDYLRKQHAKWHNKQIAMINDHMSTYGPNVIPKGIIVVPECDLGYEGDAELLAHGDSDYVTASDGEDTYSKPRCEFRIDDEDDLTMEELVAAETFLSMYHDMNDSERRVIENICLRSQERRKPLIRRKRRLEFFNRAIATTKKWFNHCATKVTEFVQKYHKGISAFSVLMATIAGAGILYSVFNKEKDESVPESAPVACSSEGSAYDTPALKVQRVVVKAEGSAYDQGTLRTAKVNVVPQGSDDPTADQVVHTRVFPNIAMVRHIRGEGKVTMRGFFVKGNIILVPFHLVSNFDEKESQLGIFEGGFWTDVKLMANQILRIENKDLALVNLGPRVQARKDATAHFVSTKDLGTIQNVFGALVGLQQSGIPFEVLTPVKGSTDTDYSSGEVRYLQTGWWHYAPTKVGDCGSILLARSKTLPGSARILGIHTAGMSNATGGFVPVLAREQLMSFLERGEKQWGGAVHGRPLPIEVENTQAGVDQCKLLPMGKFSYYGSMDRSMCPSQPCKTALQPVPNREVCFPVTKVPAALRPVKGVSPLRKALDKYGKETKPLQPSILREVSDSVLFDLEQLPYNETKRIMTEEEAIGGIPGRDFVTPLCKVTSPGWPYQCFRPSDENGKHWLFSENTVSNDLLRDNLDARLSAAKQGLRVPSVWRDCLKDELRPIEKVEQCKTRLFTIAPVDYTILVRRYFMSFVECFYSNHTQFWSAVGINPFSLDWTKLYNNLSSVSDRGFAGDFGTFDGTLLPECMYECGEIINKWYDDGAENALIRRTLINEMIFTTQLCENCVYGTHQGNPSGNPLTVILNTMVNIMYMRYSWMILAPQAMKDMISYRKNVREIAYGDDNIIMVKAGALEFFNQVSVSGLLAEFGIEYTDETKSGVVAFKMLDDMSFLKCKFRRDVVMGPYIVAAIDRSSIENLTNWFRKTEDVEEQVKLNIECQLRFAFFHGREYFEAVRVKGTSLCDANRWSRLPHTWDYFLHLWKNTISGVPNLFSMYEVFGNAK